MANIADNVADYLEDQAIGTVGTDIFVGRIVPDPSDQIVVYATGGPQPSKHLAAMKEMTIQVYIRNTSFTAGNTKLEAVRLALHKKHGLTLDNHRILFSMASAEGGHIGQDEEGRDEFSINFLMRGYGT